MSINTNQISTLLGNVGSNSNKGVYDLLTGGNKTDTQILAGLAPKYEPTLSKTQSTAISSITNFVKNNVPSEKQSGILASVDALKKLIQFGDSEGASLDPVFSLLADNPDFTTSLKNGSFIDGLY